MQVVKTGARRQRGLVGEGARGRRLCEVQQHLEPGASNGGDAFGVRLPARREPRRELAKGGDAFELLVHAPHLSRDRQRDRSRRQGSATIAVVSGAASAQVGSKPSVSASPSIVSGVVML